MASIATPGDDASYTALDSAKIASPYDENDRGFITALFEQETSHETRTVKASDMVDSVGDSRKATMTRTDGSLTPCEITLISREGDQDIRAFKVGKTKTTNTYRLTCP